MHRAIYGFAVFFIILWIYGNFLLPTLTAPVGGILSFAGTAAAFLSSLIIAAIGYWIYAFTVRKTGAEPEA